MGKITQFVETLKIIDPLENQPIAALAWLVFPIGLTFDKPQPRPYQLCARAHFP